MPLFWITVRRIPRTVKGAQTAKVVVADCIGGDVDSAHPNMRLLLVVSELGFRVLLDEPASDAPWLQSRHKPHKYLVALPVRFAKAVLNCTARPGDTVLDPFCGSGTIPLLAAWAGHQAFGSDISHQTVHRARENIAHFGQRATLVAADARDAGQRADCIVTNLPYGVYCHLAPDALHDVLVNLTRLAPRATFVTSKPLGSALPDAGYRVTRVLAVASDKFTRYVHLAKLAS